MPASKIYTFVALCAGMAAGSTLVNRIMKPDMTIPTVPLSKQKAEPSAPAYKNLSCESSMRFIEKE